METNVIPTWHYIWKCLYWWLSTIGMPNFMLVSKSGQFSLKISTYVWRLRNRQNDSHGIRIVTQRNRHFHGFFQLLTWTRSGKSVDTTEKSALKLIKLPSLKMICWKLMKIQLFKDAKFCRRFMARAQSCPPPPPPCKRPVNVRNFAELYLRSLKTYHFQIWQFY